MGVSLVVVAGKPEGMEVAVKGTQFIIGRDKQCHLRPNSDLISKQHCVIKIAGGKVGVFDLNSTNGTYVNDKRIEAPVVLKDGDILRVGPLGFRVNISLPAVVGSKPRPNAEAAAVAVKEGDSDEEMLLDWLTPGSDEKASEHSSTIVGDKQVAEPGMESTVMELKTGDETTKIVKGGEPAPAEPKKDSSAAAADALSKYFQRRR